MKPTAKYLIELNPLLEEKDSHDIQDLISAFYECGYDWNNEEHFFFSKDLDKYIEVSSLHAFTAQNIREWWGNKDFLKEHGQLKTLTGIGCTSVLAIPIAVLVCVAYNWKVGGITAVIAVMALLLSDKRKRAVLIQRKKREGTWVDRSKIQWCKNCRHHKTIKGWEDSNSGLWTLPTIPEQDRLPCRIAPRTMHVWKAYYAMNREQRTLYPKECPEIEMKS